MVQPRYAVFEVAGFDSEELRWWQVAMRRRTVFGSWARESVVGDGGIEFDPFGEPKEEEGCVAVVAAVGPSLETPC